MIPKIIHYCWFGGNPLPDIAIKCINSWKKYFPDYKIIEWNENNFDLFSCDYCKEAYDAKKWAFVSDYARKISPAALVRCKAAGIALVARDIASEEEWYALDPYYRAAFADAV